MRRLGIILLLLCALLPAQCGERGSGENRNIVFRDHTWGSKPEELAGAVPVDYGLTDPRAREIVAARCVAYYARPQDDLNFRTIHFDQIVYKYYNDRLYEVAALFHGERNRYNAHVQLEARYGKEDYKDQVRSFSFMEDRLHWRDENASLTLGYTPIAEEGRILYRTTRYDKFLKHCLREAVYSAK